MGERKRKRETEVERERYRDTETDRNMREEEILQKAFLDFALFKCYFLIQLFLNYL